MSRARPVGPRTQQRLHGIALLAALTLRDAAVEHARARKGVLHLRRARERE